MKAIIQGPVLAFGLISPVIPCLPPPARAIGRAVLLLEGLARGTIAPRALGLPGGDCPSGRRRQLRRSIMP